MKLKYVFRNISVPLTDEQFNLMKQFVDENHLKRGAWVASLMLDAISKRNRNKEEAK